MKFEIINTFLKQFLLAKKLH